MDIHTTQIRSSTRGSIPGSTRSPVRTFVRSPIGRRLRTAPTADNAQPVPVGLGSASNAFSTTSESAG